MFFKKKIFLTSGAHLFGQLHDSLYHLQYISHEWFKRDDQEAVKVQQIFSVVTKLKGEKNVTVVNDDKK